jgi:hypothetical protein
VGFDFFEEHISGATLDMDQSAAIDLVWLMDGKRVCDVSRNSTRKAPICIFAGVNRLFQGANAVNTLPAATVYPQNQRLNRPLP